MTLREDFYEEEPWPGPESVMSIGECFKKLTEEINKRDLQSFYILVNSRVAGNHNHQLILDEVAARVNPLMTITADVNKPAEQPRRYRVKPPHSMTSDHGFDRRGRKLR